MFEAVLFDMDGTLVDTEPCGLSTLKIIQKKHDLKINEDDWVLFDKVWRRVGTDVNFESYMKNICSKSNVLHVEKVIEDFFKEYKEQIKQAPPIEGVEDLLRYLKSKNIPTAVVSASYTDQIEEVVNRHGWSDLFSVVIGFEKYNEKKPSPKGYLSAAETLDADINNCLVLEDSEAGIKSGKNAGAKVIAVKSGEQVVAQSISDADGSVNDLSEVIEILELKNL